MLGKILLFFVLSIVSGSFIHSPFSRVKGNKKSANSVDSEFKTIDNNNDILFYVYTKKSINDPQQVFLNNITSIKNSNFNSSKPTKILVHGWLDHLGDEMIQLNKNAFLDNFDVNIVAVDWSAISDDRLYFPCAKKVPDVGEYVGRFINFLITEASVKASDVHMIGHSLGAHVSGFAGKELQKNGYNVSRISGLDPAWPEFYLAKTDSRLAASDAEYVDVIHTCAFVASFPTAIGQADFFPNGGIHPQPGCSLFHIECSHKRGYKFYAESINKANVFSAQSCKSVVLGITHQCKKGKYAARMGYPADKKDIGVFYLKTNGNQPYARG